MGDRAADLEQATNYLRELVRDPPQRIAMLERLFNRSPLGILVTSDSGVLLESNRRAQQMLDYPAEELAGRRFNDITHPEDAQVGLDMLRKLVAGEISTADFEKRYLRRDGATVWVSLHVVAIREADALFFVTYIEDLTERKRVSAEHLAQQQIINIQRDLLRQISAPLIPIADGVVAMPLIGPIDQTRVAQLIEVLLGGVESNRARVVILDLTGVSALDAAAAAELLRAANGVRLLGAETLLSGIKPDSAQQIVDLGIDLNSLRAFGQLQAAIAYALTRVSPRPAG
jgi:rsbT co-antagonist protein RsbR